jgi:uncharacterized protein YdaU (DUF1376 family)
MSKRNFYIPFYPSDWLTGVADMTPVEAGIYINILAMIYDLGGPIKADHARLARRMNCSKSTFTATVIGLCAAKKLIVKDGLITNERAQIELEKRCKKAESAKASINTRWAKNDAKSSDVPYERNTDVIRTEYYLELELEKKKEQSKTDELPPAQTPSESAFKQAVAAQSKLGRSRLKKATAWSLWQRLSKQHGEDRLLAAYLRYLATDADANRDGGAYQAGLQGWLREKSEMWLEQAVRRSKPVDVDLIRSMIQTRDATPSFAWPEDRLGMSEAEARKMIA